MERVKSPLPSTSSVLQRDATLPQFLAPPGRSHDLRFSLGRIQGCAITFWHDPEERTLIFYAATLLFLANFALGVLVQFGIVDTRPFRWLHHALFFAVFASAGLAVLVGFWQVASYRWVLVPVLGLYLILPRVRAGTPGHAALALAAMVLYAAGFARTIQGV